MLQDARSRGSWVRTVTISVLRPSASEQEAACGPERGGRRDAIEQPAGHGSDDRRDLPCGRVPGDGGRQFLRGHHVGQEGLDGRAHESAGDAEGQEDQENRPDRSRSVEREEQEADDAGGLRDQAHGQDRAPVEMIRNRAGHEHERQGGEELHQPHDSEIERVAGDVVNLPAHRYADDLNREAREKSRGPIGEVTAPGEDVPGGGRRSVWNGVHRSDQRC